MPLYLVRSGSVRGPFGIRALHLGGLLHDATPSGSVRGPFDARSGFGQGPFGLQSGSVYCTREGCILMRPVQDPFGVCSDNLNLFAPEPVERSRY